jgi:hypothetical protein
MRSHVKQQLSTKSSTKMDEFHRLFEVNHKHRVLICLACQYAVVPSQVKTHLQSYYERISV